MSAPTALLYAYGVTRPGFDPAQAPAGIEDSRVEVLPAGEFSALISHVPGATYAPGVVERSSGEMEWISPRAVAHDRVLTWAQEHGGIIPMPMFSLWTSARALVESLQARDAELRSTMARVSGADEFGLRVHRRDREMLERIHELDPEIGALRREADAASPGQRYLLERKVAEQSKQAIRAASQRLAREVYAALQPLAREAVTRPLTPSAATSTDATLVLNAAFLVDRSAFDAFRAELTRRTRECEPRGLSFDFTGPWPPYHFVG